MPTAYPYPEHTYVHSIPRLSGFLSYVPGDIIPTHVKYKATKEIQGGRLLLQCLKELSKHHKANAICAFALYKGMLRIRVCRRHKYAPYKGMP